VPKVCLHDCLHQKCSATNCEAACDCMNDCDCNGLSVRMPSRSQPVAGAFTYGARLPGCNAGASN
jgi:hypothetical protein